MLDPIPIIFVLTALVGLTVLVLRRLPEMRRMESNPHPTWTKGVTFKSVLSAVVKNAQVIVKQLFKAVMFAKSEFKNSRDMAKHLSKSVRNRFDRKRIEVKEASESEQEDDESEQDDDLAQAERLLDKGEYLAAEEAAINILKRDSTYKPAYEFLGELYIARKNWLEAVEIYRYLIKQSPTNDKYWKALGDSLVGLEDYQEAKKAYHRSLEFYATPEVFVALGLSYQALEDYNSAVKAFESALDLEPENTQVLMLLAQAFVHREEPEAAREVLEQVLEIEPNNHIARERLMQLKI